MHDIDVHILRSSNENSHWLSECLNSLSNELINIHHSPSIKGDTRLARFNAYHLGGAPYVSYVDSDDMIVPGIFELCKVFLDENPGVGGVYTRSYLIDTDGGVTGLLENTGDMIVHQLVVMRRVHVIDTYNKSWTQISPVRTESIDFFREYTAHGWQQINKMGYKWRLHGTNTHNAR